MKTYFFHNSENIGDFV